MDREKTELIKALKKFKKQNRIEKLYLFGSQAIGKTHKWSDVDLIVVSGRFKGKGNLERSPELHLSWNLDYPVDLLCYTPEEFDRLKKRVSIVSEALKEGIEIN
ncbi:MAG TPA: nucleotidyltransferase domain-containing protein [archaeon]|nr:nucleotidyltransferase domain-containing protein [archaeon]